MLTRSQQDARQGKLTASRIACLMVGDAERIMALYREMTGQQPEEDLSDVWPVQLGAATEALNLDWYQCKGNPVSRRGEVVVHPIFPWAAATLDGWDSVLHCPIEAKHVGGREPLEVIINRYQPQMQFQMECTQASQCALSVIMGASAPAIEYIPFDHAYTTEMIRRGAQFMDFVRRREPPVALAPVPPPMDASKLYDMTSNNVWADSAAEWIATKPFARRADDAEKILKAAVPTDAKKCFGHGVRVTRDRAGRLSLREDKNEAA